MSFTEKPPILRGTPQEQLNALRDYLFRMAQSLNAITAADAALAVTETVRPDGTRVYETGKAKDSGIEAVRKSAQELRDLIIKTANQTVAYVDSKTEVYNSMYVSQSDFGTYTETVQATFETTARGVVDSYHYSDAIDSLNDYFTQVNGEIRRGIIEDPDHPGQYITGIAISQNLQFSGECGPSDANNPGDGYTYYYLNTGQTFGLYTSTGWQFWIAGQKVGWFDSIDGMLHVANILVENALQLGDSWQIRASASEFEIKYIGG